MIPVYDDFSSFLHTIAGGLASYYGGWIGLTIIGAFTAYQIFEKEQAGNKGRGFHRVQCGFGFWLCSTDFHKMTLYLS